MTMIAFINRNLVSESIIVVPEFGGVIVPMDMHRAQSQTMDPVFAAWPHHRSNAKTAKSASTLWLWLRSFSSF